jgi:hypothetical protein
MQTENVARAGSAMPQRVLRARYPPSFFHLEFCMTSLFEPIEAGSLRLPNRIAMAPLTRNRAPDAIPTPLMQTYYVQRASAGLLISEGTAISHQGQGYADVPGLYGEEQLRAWKKSPMPCMPRAAASSPSSGMWVASPTTCCSQTASPRSRPRR